MWVCVWVCVCVCVYLDRGDHGRVSVQDSHGLGGAHIPDANGLVAAAGRHERVLVVDVHVADLLLMAAQRGHKARVVRPPHLDQVIVGARQHVAARAVEAHAIDGREVAEYARVRVYGAIELRLHQAARVHAAAELTLVQVDQQVARTVAVALGVHVSVGVRRVVFDVEAPGQRARIRVLRELLVRGIQICDLNLNCVRMRIS